MIKDFKSIRKLLTILPAVLLLLASCGEEKQEEEIKSMSDIQAEEGMPVEIGTIELRDFTKNLSYYATLSGIKEATEYSAMGDEIEKVHFKVGDYVQEGKIVMEFPKDNPTMQYEQAKLGYELSQKNYDRMKALYEAGEIAKAKLDGAETQYLVDKRNFETMKQMIFVDAPISGTLVRLHVAEGSDIGSGKPMFTVAQLNRIKAKLWVTESEVRSIRTGMPAEIRTSEGETFSGRITEVSLSMDQMRRAFSVEAEFPNPQKVLKPGVTERIFINTYNKKDAVVIPMHLVNTDNQGKFVYVANNEKAKKQYVELGKVNEIDVEILNGLKPGDRLITKGQAMVKEGQKLNIVN